MGVRREIQQVKGETRFDETLKKRNARDEELFILEVLEVLCGGKAPLPFAQ